MKKQYLDFEMAQNFFIEMTLYNSELFEKTVGMLNCDFRYRYCSQ